jgi:ABC-2 type transport system ATP-binding protein
VGSSASRCRRRLSTRCSLRAIHLRLQSTLQSVPKPQRETRAEELLHRVGLVDAADRKVAGYSGGMKRRLDLALALVHSPRILFLDEPTTGLDPQSRTDIWNEVALMRREAGVTVFLTTQYLERPTCSRTGSGSSTRARSSPREHLPS